MGTGRVEAEDGSGRYPTRPKMTVTYNTIDYNILHDDTPDLGKKLVNYHTRSAVTSDVCAPPRPPEK